MKKSFYLLILALATAMFFFACGKDTPGGSDDIAVTGITLDTHAQSLVVGEEFSLTATVEPAEATDKKVAWEYDKTVVSVVADPENPFRMIVTALKEGSTTIEVSTVAVGADGQPFTDRCEVTVSEVVIPLTGISLTPNNATIRPGETASFEIAFEPENATDKRFRFEVPKGTAKDEEGVEYQYDVATAAISADNANVIEVTGVAAGVTALRVIAEAKDANGNDITAACSITVPRLVTGLELVPASATIKAYENLTLGVIFTPLDPTTRELAWESSDPAVASVANGIVAGVAAGGPVTITATTTDGSDIKATCTIYVEAADVEHPFGVIGFKSSQTWTGGGLVWSDYVTGSRCEKGTLSTADANGDCMQSVGADNTEYYQLFSFTGVTKYRTVLCANGWRTPTVADYQALDLELYPRSLPMGWQNHSNGSAEYVAKWGMVYGGYHNGTAVMGQDAEIRIWTGEIPTTNQLKYFRAQKADKTTVEASATARSTAFGMPLRCVKDAE